MGSDCLVEVVDCRRHRLPKDAAGGSPLKRVWLYELASLSFSTRA